MTLPFTIRKARPRDVAAVHGVHTEAIRAGVGGHYTPEVVDVWLDASVNAVGFYAKHGWTEVERHARVRKGVEIPVVKMEKNLGT